MERRNFLLGSLTLGASAATPMSAYAYTRCMPNAQFGEVCESGIGLSHIAAASQRESQWCWAACVQMTFAHYGYSVSQERIVQETYGMVANIPAVTGYAISKNLQRDWIDDNGDAFSVEIEGLYDFNAGILGITDQEIVRALDDERPLIMGTVSHAVLLTAVAYVPFPMGPQIVNIGVADPWPGVGLRGPRSPADLIPMDRGGDLRYLCLANVY